MGSDTYYEILGLPPTAGSAEIKARYRQLILRIHPDVDGSVALFRQVQQAYEVLSDPVLRASYDRALDARRSEARSGSKSSPPGGARSRRTTRSVHASPSSSRHPAAPFGLSGVILVVFGASFAEFGPVLILLGLAALALAGMATLGTRGAKEWAAYQRSGIAAIDAMTARQFEALLEHYFANRGYRVARINGRRGGPGSRFLLVDANGRLVVRASRQADGEQPDMVREALTDMGRYGAERALVLTTSPGYPQGAVAAAKRAGVALWDRATLASQLTSFRGEPVRPTVRRLSSELRTGSRICLGFITMVFVVLVATRSDQGRSAQDPHPGERPRTAL